MYGVPVTASVPRSRSFAPQRYAQGAGWQLYGGDSLSLLSRFDAQSFDLVFADPPYFLSNGGSTCQGGKRTEVHKGEWDASNGHQADADFTRAWLEGCRRVLKPSGTLWVSGTHHVIFHIGFALQELGYKVLNTVTWFKPNASPNLSCRYFTHSTEILIWAAPASKGKLKHVFNYAEMKAENGGKQMRDVWTMTAPKKGEKAFGRHPTQKPLTLLERIVRASTLPGGRILDPFMGSGTTGVAAKSLGRQFVGIEREPKYLELARRRIEAAETPRQTH